MSADSSAIGRYLGFFFLVIESDIYMNFQLVRNVLTARDSYLP